MEIQYAAEFGWVIAVFILLSFIADFVKKQRARREEQERLRRTYPDPHSSGTETGTVTGAGDTQREGRSLEEFLRGLEQVMSGEEPAPSQPPSPPRRPAPRTTPAPGASTRTGPPRSMRELSSRPRPHETPARVVVGPRGRAPDRRLAGHEDIEEREVLEVEPEVRSLEVGGRSRDIVAADLDLTAEATIQQRLRAAEARNRPHTSADHRTFHEKMRQEPADATRVAARKPTGFTPGDLRRAFVWREILGPPKGLDS